MSRTLCLADGTVFSGVGFGGGQTVVGEVVFNTAMSGYQEILTDPSYVGQIVVMTCPEIGNTGTNATDDESAQPWARGFVVRSPSPMASSHRNEETLPAYMVRHGVTGLADIDTRKLVRHLRSGGVQMGALGPTDDVTKLLELARAAPPLGDLTRACATKTTYAFGEGSQHVVAIDFGLKKQMLQCLSDLDCRVTVVPPDTSAEAILALQPNGIFLTNGPGDPAAVQPGRDTVRALLGKKPIFGICLGHQILALALGARTFKLPFGHRGANQPVRNHATGRIDITTQNHGYAVDAASLPAGVSVTYSNCNDGTVEGLAAPALQAMSVQHHPEASPGPHDARHLFATFISMMRNA